MKISVKVLDRTLNYTVRPEDESHIRKAVKSIDAKLADLKSKNALRDNQEALTIVLIQVAYFLEKLKAEDEVGRMVEEIKYLDGELDKYFDDNKL